MLIKLIGVVIIFAIVFYSLGIFDDTKKVKKEYEEDSADKREEEREDSPSDKE